MYMHSFGVAVRFGALIVRVRSWASPTPSHKPTFSLCKPTNREELSGVRDEKRFYKPQANNYKALHHCSELVCTIDMINYSNMLLLLIDTSFHTNDKTQTVRKCNLLAGFPCPVLHAAHMFDYYLSISQRVSHSRLIQTCLRIPVHRALATNCSNILSKTS